MRKGEHAAQDTWQRGKTWGGGAKAGVRDSPALADVRGKEATSVPLRWPSHRLGWGPPRPTTTSDRPRYVKEIADVDTACHMS